MPVLLDKQQGYLLERCIPEHTGKDLMYPYPMFTCTSEDVLLDSLKDPGVEEYVTATIVTDPLYSITPSPEKWDLCLKWKTHLVLDCSQTNALSFNAKVRYYSKRSHDKYGYRVRFVREGKLDYLSDWFCLWNLLVSRHNLLGLKALSERYFSSLFSLDEPLLAVLFDDSGVHSIHIWITQGDTAYSHLHASDKLVYDTSANYLLYSAELSWLAENGYRRILLGSSSGSNQEDGLFSFKKQFANSESYNHLLGLIISKPLYSNLTGSAIHTGGYFPMYRSGELL